MLCCVALYAGGLHVGRGGRSGRLAGNRLIVGTYEPEIRESLREMQRFATRFGARGVRLALLGVDLETRVEITDEGGQLVQKLEFNVLPGRIDGGTRRPGMTRPARACGF